MAQEIGIISIRGDFQRQAQAGLPQELEENNNYHKGFYK